MLTRQDRNREGSDHRLIKNRMQITKEVSPLCVHNNKSPFLKSQTRMRVGATGNTNEPSKDPVLIRGNESWGLCASAHTRVTVCLSVCDCVKSFAQGHTHFAHSFMRSTHVYHAPTVG